MNNILERLFDEQELASITGLSVGTIRRRRLLKQPPRYIKLGNRVLYRPADVADWIEQSAVPANGTNAQHTRQSKSCREA